MAMNLDGEPPQFPPPREGVPQNMFPLNFVGLGLKGNHMELG